MDWIHSPHFASFLLLLFVRLLNEVSERASAHIFATQTSCLNEKWINKNTVFSCIHGVVIIAVSGVFVGKWRRQRQPHWVKKNWSNWLTVFFSFCANHFMLLSSLEIAVLIHKWRWKSDQESGRTSEINTFVCVLAVILAHTHFDLHSESHKNLYVYAQCEHIHTANACIRMLVLYFVFIWWTQSSARFNSRFCVCE